MLGKRFERISRPFTRVSISAVEDRTELKRNPHYSAAPTKLYSLERIERVQAIQQTFALYAYMLNMPKSSKLKLPIDQRALTGRINRTLAADGKALRKLRHGERARGFKPVGHYYVVDMRTSGIVQTHVDLEAFARELGVLAPHEELA